MKNTVRGTSNFHLQSTCGHSRPLGWLQVTASDAVVHLISSPTGIATNHVRHLLSPLRPLAATCSGDRPQETVATLATLSPCGNPEAHCGLVSGTFYNGTFRIHCVAGLLTKTGRNGYVPHSDSKNKCGSEMVSADVKWKISQLIVRRMSSGNSKETLPAM
jgi:hypothetical protein